MLARGCLCNPAIPGYNRSQRAGKAGFMPYGTIQINELRSILERDWTEHERIVLRQGQIITSTRF